MIGPREDRWYLKLMSPNTKGDNFPWLDPSSIYTNATAFTDLLDDLTAELNAEDIDVVAGLDAIDFVLAAGIAARIQRGFLPIFMVGKLCEVFDKVGSSSYSGGTQNTEVRPPAFAKGTRVLLVRQWIETGNTMDAAIHFVKRQGGSVAGVVAIAIETTERTQGYRMNHKCASAVLPGTSWQEQCDRRTLDSFADYQHEATFPTAGRS